MPAVCARRASNARLTTQKVPPQEALFKLVKLLRPNSKIREKMFEIPDEVRTTRAVGWERVGGRPFRSLTPVAVV
jgi:hypothetical protein